MRKEKITLDSIRRDLSCVVSLQMYHKEQWRFTYIMPCAMLAVMAVIFLKSIFIALLIFSVAVYHIVKYINEYREYMAKKNALMSMIDRGEISISNEVLSHITDRTIYEPHSARGLMYRRPHTTLTRTIRVYCFEGGLDWRVPSVERHYPWSKDFYLSQTGFENISCSGDAFFFVRLQNHSEVAYIYPCKIFELDSSLKR